MEGRLDLTGERSRISDSNPLLATLMLPAKTLFAQAPVAALPYSLLATPQLTGDWFGTRSSLAESGITFLADSTNFYFGNTAGGLTRDFEFAGHNDYVMFVDGAALRGMEGFSVKIKAEHRYGETLYNEVGAFFSPSILADLPKVNSERVYLTNVLFTQAYQRRVRGIRRQARHARRRHERLWHGRGKTQFSNLAFVFNPIAAATVYLIRRSARLRRAPRRRTGVRLHRAESDGHHRHQRLRTAFSTMACCCRFTPVCRRDSSIGRAINFSAARGTIGFIARSAMPTSTIPTW